MKGVAAEISSCLGAIFQNIVSRTLATERKELRLTSSFSDGRIDVEFKWTGPVRKSALKDFRGYPTIRAVLEKYGINYTQSLDGEFQVLNLSAPVSQE
jgi:hypothetical protein